MIDDLMRDRSPRRRPTSRAANSKTAKTTTLGGCLQYHSAGLGRHSHRYARVCARCRCYYSAMFVQIVVKDTIKILPSQFGKDYATALIDQIHTKYSNKVRCA